MDKEEFQLLLRDWCQQDDEEGEAIRAVKSDVDYVENQLYAKYRPTSSSVHPEFRTRLARWVGSAESENDQKNLYRLLKYLFFVSNEDMDAAHLTAYSKNIAQWLISCENISFFDHDARTLLHEAFTCTAYTELTDSFGIGDFCHLNNIDGSGTRFTWNQHIEHWSDEVFYKRVLKSGEKKYIVLLEDFVGSGSQTISLLSKACTLPNDLKVLYCPMIICPEGAEIARNFQREYQHFTFSPVLELPEYHFIKDTGVPAEPHDYERIRCTLKNNHKKVAGGLEMSPFGYRDIGAILVKYDNCPDNTVPVLHHQSALNWYPLFLRVSREDK